VHHLLTIKARRMVVLAIASDRCDLRGEVSIFVGVCGGVDCGMGVSSCVYAVCKDFQAIVTDDFWHDAMVYVADITSTEEEFGNPYLIVIV